MKRMTSVKAVKAALVACCFAMVGVAGAQNQTLKIAGVDDEAVAEAYYATIDPTGDSATEAGWEEVNGFDDPRNTVVVAKGYFNRGDLGFFRSIHMVRDRRPGYEGNIAFATVNYFTEEDALNEVNKVSIVNMEYSPGPDGEPITKFYVFDPDDGRRLPSTTFSDGGEELFVPAACFSCHGGDDDQESPVSPEGYNDGSGETNGSFLAFDINTMEFSDNVPRASLEKAFKKFNKGVLRTDPTRATRTLIKGLYGGPGLPNAAQDLSYIPTSWMRNPKNAELYREVIVPSCRLCHTVADTKVLRLSWWKANPHKVRESVFHELTMPNAIPSFERFWNSTNPSQSDLTRDALERFESN